MARYWDIKRRKKEKRITPTEKKQKKKNASWMFFLCLIGAFFLAFAGASKMPSFNPVASSSPSSIPSLNQVKTTEKPDKVSLNKSNLKVKLINGTGLFEELNKYKVLLSQSGYNIKTAENALNVYPETIIYYEEPAKSYADELLKVFGSYKPKLSVLSQNTDFDIIIVVGKN